MADVTEYQRPIRFAIFTILLGVVGWFASFQLLTERLKFLADPEYIPNCNLSVLVTCGPNMTSWQGSVFGFTNTAVGVALFVIPIVIGFALLAGARFDGWFWMLYQAGTLFGFGFITWLFSQSVYSLGTLCPWCMVVWAAMIPLWWTTLLRPFAVGDIPLPGGGQQVFGSLYAWTWVIVLANYILLAVLAQLELNWVGEFVRWLT